MMKKFLFFISLVFVLNLNAKEGMWIPSIVDAFMIDDMRSMGFELSAEDIYSINSSSMKDGIVHFGGGCTAEIMSPKGLIFTNHHCGYSQIQSHSSVENDYLQHGFWAKNLKEELPNLGLTATLIVRIDQVTNEVLVGVTDDMDINKKGMTIRRNIAEIIEQATKNNHYEAVIKPFSSGNEYFMLVKETYKDVRLVGAPPSAIGKFGGDTDNWMWPRHTGDFSVFRIYADANNNPAAYDENNKPYEPKHFFPINIKEKKVNDFTMVYGFPGVTEQHLISNHVQFIIEKENPAKIKMRENSLSVIDAAMKGSDLTRIQYAAKQSGISNAYKKWIGQNGGLINVGAINKKLEWENEYQAKAKTNQEWKKYYDVVDQLKNLHLQYENEIFARSLLVEYYYYGPEFLRFANEFSDLVYGFASMDEDLLNKKKEELQKKAKSFYKNYDAKVDRGIFKKLTQLYLEFLEPAFVNEILKGDLNKLEKEIYETSFFTDEKRTMDLLGKINKKTIKTIEKDKAYILSDEILTVFRSKVLLELQGYNQLFDSMMKVYEEGLKVMFPEKTLWPDANSTLRFTYGKIEGSAPHNGMEYQAFTTIDGIIQKYKTGNPDYELPQRFIDLYEEKKFGKYAQNGTLPICFTASNHTTGGNSGSPALDKNGHYIGINFDRSWESTMSDIMFDPDRCRNIMVDSRYILWVIDIYAEAGYLLDEMEIIEDIDEDKRAQEEIKNKTKQIKQDPQNGSLLFERAEYFMQVGLFDDALIDLEAGLKYAPNHEGINYHLTKIYLKKEVYKKATERHAHLLKHYDEVEHHILGGDLRSKMGEWDKALVHYEKAYSMSKQDYIAQKVLMAEIMKKSKKSICNTFNKMEKEENKTVTIKAKEVCH